MSNQGKSFAYLRIQSFSDLEFLSNIRNGYFFRGQGNTEWMLQSALERACLNFLAPPDIVEKKMLDSFKSKAHLYDDNVPNDHQNVEWLALMQHYGAPTRLLDFSQSAFVAAFFSCFDIDKTKDGAIWVLNEFQCFSWNDSRPVVDITILNDIISGKQKDEPAICMVQPKRINLRMNAQSGCFVAQTSLKGSFMDNLLYHERVTQTDISAATPLEWNSLDYKKLVEMFRYASIIKIEIPARIKSDIIDRLQTFQITKEKLFPDLGGLAEFQYQVLRSEITEPQRIFPGFSKY